MCLIIHKPARTGIPEDLLRAALVHNADGWGVMGFERSGRSFVHKGAAAQIETLIDLERRYRDAELALHLRRQTRGSSGEENAHPFRILEGLYLMHNGTLDVPLRVPDRSDTWHFVRDVLRPLAQRYPGLLSDYGFVRVLEFGLRPDNKAALFDRGNRRLVLINREHGAEFEGLWLSSIRWIDRALFPLTSNTPGVTQARSYAPTEVGFTS